MEKEKGNISSSPAQLAYNKLIEARGELEKKKQKPYNNYNNFTYLEETSWIGKCPARCRIIRQEKGIFLTKEVTYILKSL